MRRLRDVALGVVLLRLLGGLGQVGDPTRRAGSVRPADAPGDGIAPDRRLLAVMLGCFGVGSLLMLLFEAPVTRVLGLLALVAFMVTGVFLVASPAFLTGDEES